MVLSPRDSAKLIASLSKHVRINLPGIENLGNKLIDEIKNGNLSIDLFSQSQLHPKSENPKAVDWIFLVDTLNFCFWSKTEQKNEKWTVEGHTGYFALCAAINRAIKENIDILNPLYYTKITEENLSRILRSDTNVQIPLLKERVKSLHQVGAVLLSDFEGTFENVLKKANGSAVRLLSLIVTNFDCFKDEALYKNNHVSLYKRAQILVGDIWACFKNRGIGHFDDIDEITMFADYRVPQSLLLYDCLEYSDELMGKLQEDFVFENGAEEEVEIRGNSIQAVELICEYVRRNIAADQSGGINAILVDHYLWDFRRKFNDKIIEKKLPFHKTFCIYY